MNSINQKIEFVFGNVATEEAVMLDRLAILRVQLEGGKVLVAVFLSERIV